MNTHRRATASLAGRTRTPADFRPRGLRWGFTVTFGGLGALAAGFALFSLRAVFFSIVLAAFATVGLDPLVRLL